MAIHYTCRCGANIRLPNSVAGRKARCNSCGFIFAVPLADLNPEPEAIPLEPGLPEVVRQPQATPKPEPGLLDGSDKEDILAPAVVLPVHPRETSISSIPDEDRGGVIDPTKPYLQELVESFFFFLDAGSFVTFIIISLINIWTVPLSYAGPIGVVGLALLSGYLCTFYMSVIKETAGGEDELPNVWVGNVLEDLVLGGFRFVATWAWVLLPAAALAIIEYVNLGQIDWQWVTVLAAVGLFFWPVVILGVSIGGGFWGLWPHTIIRTAAAAPLAYLAMCFVLLLAAGMNIVPHTEVYRKALAVISTKTNRSLFWAVMVINAGLNAYTMIIAMRAIGLYYRHYKRRFPWVAE